MMAITTRSSINVKARVLFFCVFGMSCFFHNRVYFVMSAGKSQWVIVLAGIIGCYSGKMAVWNGKTLEGVFMKMKIVWCVLVLLAVVAGGAFGAERSGLEGKLVDQVLNGAGVQKIAKRFAQNSAPRGPTENATGRGVDPGDARFGVDNDFLGVVAVKLNERDPALTGQFALFGEESVESADHVVGDGFHRSEHTDSGTDAWRRLCRFDSR